MVNSICIKTNNTNIISYLLNSFEQTDLSNIFLSQNSFKNYKNVIVHYRGDSIELFYSKLAESLSNTVIACCEKNFIKKIINSNYFYFNDIEKKTIFNIASDCLQDEENSQFYDRNKSLFIAFLKYIVCNKCIVLDGFLNFRTKDYLSILDEAVDFSVNKFLIEREYNEFVNILKSYIKSKISNTPFVHLVYRNQESILLDENQIIIDTNDSIFETKYLSDITFSSNDYCLNTLLTLLPEKLYIHMINSYEDEFINTLKLIFDNRIHICNDCNICKVYREKNLKLNLNKQ